MILELKNIAKLKNAFIKLDGITVIGGENDTGKSSIGKSLLMLLKTELTARNKYHQKNKTTKNNLDKYYKNNRKYGFERLREILFENFLRSDYNLYPNSFNEENFIKLTFNKNHFKVFYDKNNNEWKFDNKSMDKDDILSYIDISYIQSPLIWDLQSFFNSILQIKTQVEMEEDIKFNFSYPYLLWDLYGKLINKRIKHISKFHQTQLEVIKNIIGGEFVKKSGNSFMFKKNNVEIPLIDVAHGIKSFGILQILIENGYISPKGILIFDEPEVHLHPTWQLEYAKLIANFAKQGIKIIVNTHSPYMIEAIDKYSKLFNIKEKTNFYISENNEIKQIGNSNALTLERIFEKLSLPFDIFEKIDEELESE